MRLEKFERSEAWRKALKEFLLMERIPTRPRQPPPYEYKASAEFLEFIEQQRKLKQNAQQIGKPEAKENLSDSSVYIVDSPEESVTAHIKDETQENKENLSDSSIYIVDSPETSSRCRRNIGRRNRDSAGVKLETCSKSSGVVEKKLELDDTNFSVDQNEVSVVCIDLSSSQDLDEVTRDVSLDPNRTSTMDDIDIKKEETLPSISGVEKDVAGSPHNSCFENGDDGCIDLTSFRDLDEDSQNVSPNPNRTSAIDDADIKDKETLPCISGVEEHLEGSPNNITFENGNDVCIDLCSFGDLDEDSQDVCTDTNRTSTMDNVDIKDVEMLTCISNAKKDITCSPNNSTFENENDVCIDLTGFQDLDKDSEDISLDPNRPSTTDDDDTIPFTSETENDFVGSPNNGTSKIGEDVCIDLPSFRVVDENSELVPHISLTPGGNGVTSGNDLPCNSDTRENNADFAEDVAVVSGKDKKNILQTTGSSSNSTEQKYEEILFDQTEDEKNISRLLPAAQSNSKFLGSKTTSNTDELTGLMLREQGDDIVPEISPSFHKLDKTFEIITNNLNTETSLDDASELHSQKPLSMILNKRTCNNDLKDTWNINFQTESSKYEAPNSSTNSNYMFEDMSNEMQQDTNKSFDDLSMELHSENDVATTFTMKYDIDTDLESLKNTPEKRFSCKSVIDKESIKSNSTLCRPTVAESPAKKPSNSVHNIPIRQRSTKISPKLGNTTIRESAEKTSLNPSNLSKISGKVSSNLINSSNIVLSNSFYATAKDSSEKLLSESSDKKTMTIEKASTENNLRVLNSSDNTSEGASHSNLCDSTSGESSEEFSLDAPITEGEELSSPERSNSSNAMLGELFSTASCLNKNDKLTTNKSSSEKIHSDSCNTKTPNKESSNLRSMNNREPSTSIYSHSDQQIVNKSSVDMVLFNSTIPNSCSMKASNEESSNFSSINDGKPSINIYTNSQQTIKSPVEMFLRVSISEESPEEMSAKISNAKVAEPSEEDNNAPDIVMAKSTTMPANVCNITVEELLTRTIPDSCDAEDASQIMSSESANANVADPFKHKSSNSCEMTIRNPSTNFSLNSAVDRSYVEMSSKSCNTKMAELSNTEDSNSSDTIIGKPPIKISSIMCNTSIRKSSSKIPDSRNTITGNSCEQLPVMSGEANMVESSNKKSLNPRNTAEVSFTTTAFSNLSNMTTENSLGEIPPKSCNETVEVSLANKSFNSSKTKDAGTLVEIDAGVENISKRSSKDDLIDANSEHLEIAVGNSPSSEQMFQKLEGENSTLDGKHLDEESHNANSPITETYAQRGDASNLTLVSDMNDTLHLSLSSSESYNQTAAFAETDSYHSQHEANATFEGVSEVSSQNDSAYSLKLEETANETLQITSTSFYTLEKMCEKTASDPNSTLFHYLKSDLNDTINVPTTEEEEDALNRLLGEPLLKSNIKSAEDSFPMISKEDKADLLRQPLIRDERHVSLYDNSNISYRTSDEHHAYNGLSASLTIETNVIDCKSQQSADEYTIKSNCSFSTLPAKVEECSSTNAINDKIISNMKTMANKTIPDTPKQTDRIVRSELSSSTKFHNETPNEDEGDIDEDSSMIFNDTLEEVDFMMKKAMEYEETEQSLLSRKEISNSSPSSQSFKTPTNSISHKSSPAKGRPLKSHLTPLKEMPKCLSPSHLFKVPTPVKTKSKIETCNNACVFKTPTIPHRNDTNTKGTNKVSINIKPFPKLDIFNKSPAPVPTKQFASVQKQAYSHIVSPLREYIRKTPKTPLMFENKPSTLRDNAFAQLDMESHESSPIPANSASDHTKSSQLPKKAYISSDYKHVVDERSQKSCIGGQKIQRYLNSNAQAAVFRHDGKAVLPKELETEDRPTASTDNSIADLSVMQGNVSLYTIKDARKL